MIEASIARRYSQALLELAGETSRAERVGDELADFSAMLEREPLVREVLVNPGFTKDERKSLLSALLERSGYIAVTRDFLLLLVDKSRIAAYAPIAREYSLGLDAMVGRVRAEVRSAVPLDGDTLTRLKGHLASVTGKEVVLNVLVDPSLIGGMVTQVGSMVFDGSVRTQLENLRYRLLSEQVGIA